MEEDNEAQSCVHRRTRDPVDHAEDVHLSEEVPENVGRSLLWRPGG